MTSVRGVPEYIDPRFRGNYVIMLDVDVPALWTEWLQQNAQPGWTWKQHHHVTLQFVGRELGHGHARALANVAIDLVKTGTPLQVAGFDIFETQRNLHLVSVIQQTDALIALHGQTRNLLRTYGVMWRDGFPFNPHVTLGERPRLRGETALTYTRSKPVLDGPVSLTPRSVTAKLGQERLTVSAIR